MKLAEAIQKAKSTQPDSHTATVAIDEPWASTVEGKEGERQVLTHSPGLVSLDYLREHVETAEALKK